LVVNCKQLTNDSFITVNIEHEKVKSKDVSQIKSQWPRTLPYDILGSE
jgi:hypothetical protein